MSDSDDSDSSSRSSSEQESCDEDRISTERSPVAIKRECFQVKGTVPETHVLKAITADSALITTEELTSPKNEIWIFSIPSNFDARKLQDLTIPLTKSSKVNISSNAYETSAQNCCTNAAFVLPNQDGDLTLVSRDVVGLITLAEDIENLGTIDNAVIIKKAETAPPIILKRRHPIYGADHDGYVSAPPEKLAKMTTTPSNSSKHKKKKKSNK